MARARDPNRDKAFDLFKQSNGEMLLKDIAEQLGKSDSQIRKWKSQDKWDARLKGNVTIDDKGNVTKRSGAPKGNKNAVGNKGNSTPEPKFTERNSIAKKHGLFSRYIPKETLEIMGMLEKSDPADLIWDQIQIQYAAIIRSQEIMFVESKDEMIKELKKHKESDSGEETEWEFQFAWERQTQFLNAQSRAISELRSSVNQFIKITDEADERRLKLEQMQLTIDKTKAEISNISKSQGQSVTVIIEDDVYE